MKTHHAATNEVRMRILVTGGAGFIGSHFVRTLVSGGYDSLTADGPFAGADVTVLDALTYAGVLANLDPVIASPRLRFVEGNILDEALVDELMADTDTVVHFAAESHVDRSITGARDFIMTNVVGTQTLLDAARRHQIARFVHVSTDEVYGSIDEGSWPETHPLEPNSPYAASKASSDLIARSYARTHGRWSAALSIAPCRVTRGSARRGFAGHRRRRCGPPLLCSLTTGRKSESCVRHAAA